MGHGGRGERTFVLVSETYGGVNARECVGIFDLRGSLWPIKVVPQIMSVLMFVGADFFYRSEISGPG